MIYYNHGQKIDSIIVNYQFFFLPPPVIINPVDFMLSGPLTMKPRSDFSPFPPWILCCWAFPDAKSSSCLRCFAREAASPELVLFSEPLACSSGCRVWQTIHFSMFAGVMLKHEGQDHMPAMLIRLRGKSSKATGGFDPFFVSRDFDLECDIDGLFFLVVFWVVFRFGEMLREGDNECVKRFFLGEWLPSCLATFFFPFFKGTRSWPRPRMWSRLRTWTFFIFIFWLCPRSRHSLQTIIHL